MELTAQIPDVTVGRAATAPHYEYLTTFGKRTAELPVDHERYRCAGLLYPALSTKIRKIISAHCKKRAKKATYRENRIIFFETENFVNK